jgi:N utilization substance protein B
MASRRRAREYGLQALYESDLRRLTADDVLNHLWSGVLDGDDGDDDLRPPEQAEIDFTQRLVVGVESHRDDLDLLIESCSTNWRLERMPIVDRNILRLASFEMVHCSDIPANVSINEAVELAKRFGGAESRAFVNGILDRLSRAVHDQGENK